MAKAGNAASIVEAVDRIDEAIGLLEGGVDFRERGNMLTEMRMLRDRLSKLVGIVEAPQRAEEGNDGL